MKLTLLLFVVALVFADESSGEAPEVAQPKNQYKFDLSEDGVYIKAKTKGLQAEIDTSTATTTTTKYSEEFKYRIKVGKHGFRMSTQYKVKSKHLRSHLNFRHSLRQLIEFKKNDADSTDEAFDGSQTKVQTYKLDDWNEAEYSACTDDGPCQANFTTTNGCISIIVKANLDGVSPDSRVKLSRDDVKMDYVITDACQLSAPDSAWALVGRVASSEGAYVKDKKHNKGGKGKGKGKGNGTATQLELEDSEESGTGRKKWVHDEDSGFMSAVADESVAAFFTWLEDVDCLPAGSSERKPRPVITDVDELTEDEIAEEEEEEEEEEEPEDEEESGEGRRLLGKGKGKKASFPKPSKSLKSGMRFRWTFHTQQDDGECIWDPTSSVENTDKIPGGGDNGNEEDDDDVDTPPPSNGIFFVDASGSFAAAASPLLLLLPLLSALF